MSGSVPEIMVFYPTYEEFKDFNKYIKYMESQGAHKAGLAKIIPPKEWVPRKGSYEMSEIGGMIVPAPITQKVTGKKKGLNQQFSEHHEPMSVRDYKKLAESNNNTDLPQSFLDAPKRKKMALLEEQEEGDDDDEAEDLPDDVRAGAEDIAQEEEVPDDEQLQVLDVLDVDASGENVTTEPRIVPRIDRKKCRKRKALADGFVGSNDVIKINEVLKVKNEERREKKKIGKPKPPPPGHVPHTVHLMDRVLPGVEHIESKEKRKADLEEMRNKKKQLKSDEKIQKEKKSPRVVCKYENGFTVGYLKNVPANQIRAIR